MRLIFRLFALAGFLASLAVIGLVVLVALVVFGGSGKVSCHVAEGQPVTAPAYSPLGLIEFDRKWVVFLGGLELGVPGSVSLTNDEATSKAQAYLDEKTDQVKDVRICFAPGKARASAQIRDVALGRTLSVRMEGSLDLSGPHPRLQIDSLHAGWLPLVGPARTAVADLVNDKLADLEISHQMSLSLGYNDATVRGQP